MNHFLSGGGLRYQDEASLPARRPSAGALPGRCGLRGAAMTHRLTSFRFENNDNN
jgi:hypothetical protein